MCVPCSADRVSSIATGNGHQGTLPCIGLIRCIRVTAPVLFEIARSSAQYFRRAEASVAQVGKNSIGRVASIIESFPLERAGCRYGAIARCIRNETLSVGSVDAKPRVTARILRDLCILAANGLFRQASRITSPSWRAFDTCRVIDFKLTASCSTSVSLRI